MEERALWRKAQNERARGVYNMCLVGRNGLVWEIGGLSLGNWWNWLDWVDNYVK